MPATKKYGIRSVMLDLLVKSKVVIREFKALHPIEDCIYKRLTLSYSIRFDP